MRRVLPRSAREDWTSWRRAVYGVNLGSRFATGTRLHAFADWTTEAFDQALILVGDSTYARTLQLRSPSLSLIEASRRAIARGRAFSELEGWRFRASGFRHDCKVLFHRQSDVTRSSGCRQWIRELKELLAKDATFAASMERSSGALISRHRRDDDPRPRDHMLRLARELLIEEMAVLCSVVEVGWDAVASPGSIDVVAEIAEGKHPRAPLPLREGRWLSLGLRRGAASSTGAETRVTTHATADAGQ